MATDFIPAILKPRNAIFEKYFTSLAHPLRDALQKVLLSSDYACRHVALLNQLLQQDDCQKPLSEEDYHRLAQQLADQSITAFSRALRQFRHRHFLRLLLREQAGLADTQQTIRHWSDCADALIMKTLQFCQQELTARFGHPRDATGNPVGCYVIAMGKLGGRELNYSSDVDLIFAYGAAGNTDGKEVLDNQQYFSKMVQLFIQLLQSATEEGFAFRVDLRLRPNGESGALVSSLAALETYYQEQGRDWERYAMAKARIITAPGESQPLWYERLIIPFVYRRYVDFGVIESLRSMKALIEREIKLNPMLDDIKRGLGGIREVEFIIQNIQLIRGGRLLQLRQQNALTTLDMLQQEKLLPRTSALKLAYLFLRKLENCLQSLNDKQTHALPHEALPQAQITLAMGYAQWDVLMDQLQQFQRIISNTFRAALGTVEVYEDSERLLTNQLTSLWQGHVETAMAVNLLTSIGFEQAERCYQMIHAFRHAPKCRRLNQAARLRLDRFMPLLLRELTQVKNTEAVLLQVIHLLENIIGRSAYLALLTENPSALKELLYWFAHSPFITSLLVNHPFLLEVLLDKERDWQPSSLKQLQQQLKNSLQAIKEVELQEEVLRQFKLTHWLLAARAEMDGQIDAVQCGKFLAEIAEVIVKQVFEDACCQLALRYPEITAIKPHFAMIAYGKLGSKEMNFNSDLDLVFVHTVVPEQEGMVNRLTQKIIHMLTTRTQFGLLYPVDTRLRPSGAAGLLVSPFSAFLEYQRSHAWTWEHQALIRCRMIYGKRKLCQAFAALKADVLSKQRDQASLLAEVQTMRAKMNKHLAANDIKHVPGGLIDLEFLLQFLILSHPYPVFSQYTNTLSLLQQLAKEKILTPRQAKLLKHAYQQYHEHLHHSVLCAEEIKELPSTEGVLTIMKEMYTLRH